MLLTVLEPNAIQYNWNSVTESVVLSTKIQRKLSFRSIQIPLASISVIADDQLIASERQCLDSPDLEVPNKV